MRIEHPTYYDEFVDTAYPFESSATRSNGQVAIDDDVFVDGRLFPPDARHDIFISSIVVGDEVIITLSDRRATLGVSKFLRESPPDFLVFNTVGGIELGLLQAHPLAGLSKITGWSNGTYVFTLDQTSFAATIVVPQPQKTVRTIQLESGALFHGDVCLLGENGVQLTLIENILLSSSSSFAVFDKYSNTIRVDIVGDPLFSRKICTEEGVDLNTSSGIKGIVFRSTTILPDASGGFSFFVTKNAVTSPVPALRINAREHGLNVGFISES